LIGVADQWEAAGRFVGIVAGRWTLTMLGELLEGGRRYQEIHDALNGVSYKVLTETLRRAECDGLITRQVDPKRMETATVYQLTDLGTSLVEPLTAMNRWVGQNWPRVDKARLEWRQRRH
jgi:DNA-binding HxlR family transcriptional regulator